MRINEFINGKILFDELSGVQEDFLLQLDVLKEDMLQVEYAGKFLLDVGWYPSFDANGEFQIRVIESFNWESPILLTQAKSLQALKYNLVLAQNFITSKSSMDCGTKYTDKSFEVR